MKTYMITFDEGKKMRGPFRTISVDAMNINNLRRNLIASKILIEYRSVEVEGYGGLLRNTKNGKFRMYLWVTPDGNAYKVVAKTGELKTIPHKSRRK